MKKLILTLGDQPSLSIQEDDGEEEILNSKEMPDYYDELIVKTDNIILVESGNEEIDPNPENIAVLQLEQGVNYLQKQLANKNPRIGRLVLSEIHFNGPRCVDALIKLTHHVNTKFIRIDDPVFPAAISNSDKEKLATVLAAKQYSVILPNGEVVKPSFRDDSHFNLSTSDHPQKMSQLIAKFSPFTHYASPDKLDKNNLQFHNKQSIAPSPNQSVKP